ncbi:MAG: TIR domain-containing protein [Ruminococcaceae bacterium]|nr:TIR domain-containing protein [Oscillospiraceae bacterium]
MNGIKTVVTEQFKIIEREVLSERFKDIPSIGVFGCPSEENELDEIALDMLKITDCRVFIHMTDSGSAEEARSWAKEFKLIVFAVSDLFLESDNFARCVMYPAAMENKARILPVKTAGAGNIGNKFSRLCGNIHLLDKGDDYLKRLQSYYDNNVDPYRIVGLSEEQKELMEHLFRFKAFVSYRKKDIVELHRLIEFIREIPELRDMALFYDDALVPGENYNERLAGEMSSSDITIFVVTPSLTEENNYVIREEYPQAEREGKILIPVIMTGTDINEIRATFPAFGDLYDFSDKESLRDKFLEVAEKFGEPAGSSPEYKHLLAMAYEKGLETEKNIVLSHQLFKEAAEEGYLSSLAYMTTQLVDGVVAEEYEGEKEELLDLAVSKLYASVVRSPAGMKRFADAWSLQRFSRILFDILWRKAEIYHDEIRRTIVSLETANVIMRQEGACPVNCLSLPCLRSVSLSLSEGDYELAGEQLKALENSLKESVELSNRSSIVMEQVLRAHICKVRFFTGLMLRGDFISPANVLKARDVNEKAFEIWLELYKVSGLSFPEILAKEEFVIARLMQKLGMDDELERSYNFMQKFSAITGIGFLPTENAIVDTYFESNDILHFDLQYDSLSELRAKLYANSEWFKMDETPEELNERFNFHELIPEGVFGEVDGNFIASAYKCCYCNTRLYKTTFPEGNDPALLGRLNKDALYPARVFACPSCGKFYAVPKGRKLVQGPVYQLSPFLDKKNKVGKALFDMWWTYFDALGDVNAKRHE